MNDEPFQGRGAVITAMTWPLQSDTQEFRGFPKARPGILAILAFFVAFALFAPAFSDVCLKECPVKCPKANGTAVCEPLFFSASASLSKSLLLSGESAQYGIFVESLESNVTISCEYTVFGADASAPLAIAPGESAQIATGNFSAPSDNPGYQQIIPIAYKVRCESRISNASAPPEADYLWCGASCQEFSSIYQYPTDSELQVYQQEKLSASNLLSEAVLAISEARKMIEKAESLVLSAGAGVDTSFAQYRLLQATALLDEAMLEYGSASYSFDQSLFPDTGNYSLSAKSLASSAKAFANEAYSSLVYSPNSASREYLGWYVNATGIMLGEVEELINSLEPVINAAPELLGGGAAGWVEELDRAKDLVKEAEKLADQGKDEEALALLKQAQKILLGVKEAIERAFERVYTELLKIAIVSHSQGVQSADNFEKFVKESASVEGVNSKDYSEIFGNIKTARELLGKALGNIQAAENTTVQSKVRKEVNLALIRTSNARLELSIGAARYRIAQFKVETMVAAVSILAALASIAIIFFDMFSKERKAVLEIVKSEAVGNEEARRPKKAFGNRKEKGPAVESLSEKY